MSLKDQLIAELKHEANSTKRILEKVPMERKDWKPHEKSMSLGALALHVAEIPHWTSDIIHIDAFDFQKHYTPFKADTNEELLKVFQEKLDKAIADLSEMSDDDFKKHWTVAFGGKILYDLPKAVAIRGWAYNHLVHHRGQLSVYLRLLEVPVPGMYGPSADEK